MDKIFSYHTNKILVEEVETKSGKSFFVSGYISDDSLDLAGDIVTPNCMDDMGMQIENKTVTFDYDHEVFRKNPTILPVGKIVEKKRDEKGLWVKAELNQASPKFKDMWDSLRNGFLTGFSIAFKPVKTATKMVGDKVARVLDQVVLINVALTGAPINQGAIITDFGMKSAVQQSINHLEQEAKTMEQTQSPQVDPKAVPAQIEEKSQMDKVLIQLKSAEEQLAKQKAQIDEQGKQIAELKSAPVLKSPMPTQPEQKSATDVKSLLSMI